MTGSSDRQSAAWSRRTLNLSLLAAAVTPACAVERNDRPNGRAPGLRRGVGVHNVMSFPTLESGSDRRFVWPPYQEVDALISDEEIANIRGVGFDFVRLTVGPELFMAMEGQRARDLLDIARRIVERFRAANLSVIVDLHPTYNSDAYNPERIVDQTGLFRRYTEVVRSLAGVLGDMGEGVVLELMNEPPVAIGVRWREMSLILVQAARAEAANLPLIISGHDGGGYQELCALDPMPAALGPLIYTFHYYEPGVFTHQTQIDAARYINGLEWPPQPDLLQSHIQNSDRLIAADRSLSHAERAHHNTDIREVLSFYYERNDNAAAVARRFAEVAAWADRHQIPRDSILLGEFGVVRTHWRYTGAKETARLAWLEAVRREAEDNGFAWAVWTYRGWGGMAITAFDNPLAFDAPTLGALGLGG